MFFFFSLTECLGKFKKQSENGDSFATELRANLLGRFRTILETNHAWQAALFLHPKSKMYLECMIASGKPDDLVDVQLAKTLLAQGYQAAKGLGLRILAVWLKDEAEHAAKLKAAQAKNKAVAAAAAAVDAVDAEDVDVEAEPEKQQGESESKIFALFCLFIITFLR